MKVEVILVNSFTANGEGGNSAGVVLNADELTDVQKLKVAQEVGYSETAFVSNDNEADYEVSFFTTTGEVDFCGHATVATFFVLQKRGILSAGSYLQRTKAGLLPVVIESDGKIVMEQQLPKKLGHFSYQEIASIIDISATLLATTKLPVEVISTGLADVIIPIPNGYLDLIEPNDEVIAEFSKKHNVVGLHLFEVGEPASKFTASCRNFAPLYDISEESATGTSNGALACYLTEHLGLNSEFVFEQGRAMNCRSVITAATKTSEGKITQVRVGGYASEIGTMTVTC